MQDWLDADTFISTWDATELGAMGRDWQAVPGDGADWHVLLVEALLNLGQDYLQSGLSEHTDEISPELLDHSARLQDTRDVSLSADMTSQLRGIESLAPENWQTASLDQRAQAITTAAAELSIHFEQKIEFSIGDLQPGCMGECRPLDDACKVSMARELLTHDHPRDAIRTVVHELRHVYQQEMVRLGQHTGHNPFCVDVTTTRLWTEEFATYSTDAHRYKNLGVEHDAELFAVRVTDALYRI